MSLVESMSLKVFSPLPLAGEGLGVRGSDELFYLSR